MAGKGSPFGSRQLLTGSFGVVHYYSLGALASEVGIELDRLPYTVRLLLENVLRLSASGIASGQELLALAGWQSVGNESRAFPFMPARVLMPDLTGVPAIVDLASMRSAMARLGRDPRTINPLVPVDLVIDHSVQIDLAGTPLAFQHNSEMERARNLEHFSFLRWAQQTFQNFRLVPPGTGICHQVNLEFLSKVVQARRVEGETLAFPDTLVGLDSHTTMVNGLGVLGWGVGGIEAEAAMLGQPVSLLTPEVVGVRLIGRLGSGVTATDLVLTLTQLLRKKGVVGKFVEYTGPGAATLSLADRAMISNMSPETGATAGLFPVDDETLRYLRLTGRDDVLLDLVERYTRAQGLFRSDEQPEPHFSDLLEVKLEAIEPSMAGPRRPHDRVSLSQVREGLRAAYPEQMSKATVPGNSDVVAPQHEGLGHGAVVIAAITSCTNTSNPSGMLAAGLLAKKAVERGLTAKSHVRTSLSPGSRAVTGYLRGAGLMEYLEALGFHLTAYGCAVCIGNSGPLPEAVSKAIDDRKLVAAAVLSGNRNFEGRIHPLVRAAYLASPPLVVAYALAGTLDIDLVNEPIGRDPNGEAVFLRDIWPSREELDEVVGRTLTRGLFRQSYESVFEGDEKWRSLDVPEGELYAWDPESTYIRELPIFEGLEPEPSPLCDIVGARALVMLGDSVTTDHISPAGAIGVDSPAGGYLMAKGISPEGFNTFGARRGNHEVVMRGVWGNIRLRNLMVKGKEGAWTLHLPGAEEMSIYEAAMWYSRDSVPLVAFAGKEYGSGSSRDVAAKGPLLLGVRAVIAESFERIHRSNLVMMGILPMQFMSGESAESLGITGRESYDVVGIREGLHPQQRITVRARRDDGTHFCFETVARVDSPAEVEYYLHGGILQMVLRQLLDR